MKCTTIVRAAAVLAALASSVSAAPLATQTVAPAAAADTWVAEGVVEAVRQSAIASQVPARIVEMRVKAGDVVKAGQVLVRLDPRTAADQLASSEAQAAAAQAQLEAARRDHDRSRRLFEARFISLAAMDQAETQFKAAEAQAKASLAQARVAITQSTFNTLSAPYAGVVASVSAEVGDMASPGASILTLYDPAELRVVAQVPETYVQALKPAGSAMITIPATIDSERSFSAARFVVLPTANPATHTREVRLSLPAGTSGVSPGLFARVTFALSGSSATRITVPATALVRRPEFAAVYVVDGNGRPQLRQVRLGREAGGAVEIAAGLSPGERIAIDSAAAAKR